MTVISNTNGLLPMSFFARLGRGIALGASLLAVAGCSTLGGTGPSTGTIREAASQNYASHAIQVLELDGTVINRLQSHSARSSFAETFGDSAVSGTVVGPADTLDIAIWEAPPAVLFGVSPASAQGNDGISIAASGGIPPQQVGEDGRVSVPFVGRIEVVGLRPEQIERIIVARLQGRAHNPQAVVRLVRNDSRTVTVLGEVGTNRRVDLSPRGERLLDALASAGGSRAPIGQSTIQLARGAQRTSMPLEQVIADPAQNITLRPDDVITVEHRPFSFVALGAVSGNAEIPFEGGGISLAEALARAGGLNANRADVKGVFVFRLEPQEAIAPLLDEGRQATADGRVPVVYRLRMDDAASLFAMQDFKMRDDDVLYVATAPGVEIERFLRTISSTAFSIIAVGNAVNGSGN